MATNFKVDFTIGGLQTAAETMRQAADAWRAFSASGKTLRVGGPFETLRKAIIQQNIVARNPKSTGVQIADAMEAVQRAQAKVQSIQTPQGGVFQQVLGGIIGKGLRSVLGGVLPPAAINAIVAQLTTPIGMAAVALVGLAAAAMGAAKVMTQIATTARVTGGTIGQVAHLRMLGIDPRTSAGLRERMATDPYAQIAAVRLGGFPTAPRPFMETNEARLQLGMVAALRQVGDAEERLRLARMLQLEDTLFLAEASGSLFRSMRGLGGVQEWVMDKGAQQSATDFQASLALLTTSFQTLWMVISKIPMQMLTYAFTALSYVLTGLGVVLNFVLYPANLLLEKFREFQEWMLKLRGIEGSPQQEHADAMREHTRTMKSFGGGPRTHGAVPGFMHGMMMEQGMAGGALTYGAFALPRGV